MQQSALLRCTNNQKSIKSMALWIIDNGHGYDTAGKCSPEWADGSKLYEYEFNRDVASLIGYECRMNGIKFKMLVPEAKDISLSERVRRVNELCEKYGDCVLISIHANAGGGTGWEAFTSKGNTKSDEICEVFYEEATHEFGKEWRIRKDTTDGDSDKEAQFTLLRQTICPAIITENFFMDTERDCRFIMSLEARERIAQMHFRAIRRIEKMWFN